MGFVYKMANGPLKYGYTKRMHILDKNRTLDDRFGLNGFHEFARQNSCAPNLQLKSIRVALPTIS